jgi:hypothetical protein
MCGALLCRFDWLLDYFFAQVMAASFILLGTPASQLSAWSQVVIQLGMFIIPGAKVNQLSLDLFRQNWQGQCSATPLALQSR